MTINQDELRPVPDWQLDHKYEDKDGNEINCGKEKCSIGYYAVGISTAYSPGLLAPACQECEFTGGLDDVFNADEPRYEPGAPESFKKAAARILTLREYSPLETAIRIGRPDTAAMIDQYATED